MNKSWFFYLGGTVCATIAVAIVGGLPAALGVLGLALFIGALLSSHP